MSRLSHDQIRKACGASSHAKRDIECPVCRHKHLTLFGVDDFACHGPEPCDPDAINAAVRDKLKLIDSTFRSGAQVPKAPEAPPAGRLELAEYGLAKNLSAQVLTEYFGLTEGKHPYYDDVYGVCMPYFDANGVEITQQWRWAMGKNQETGDKGRGYRAGKPTYLYGGHFLQLLEHLAAVGKPRDDIFVAEGESNIHTLSHPEIALPALGLPGIKNWQHDWGKLKCLTAAKRVYFLLDMKEDGTPETAAIVGAHKFAESFPAGKVLAVKLPCKDISALWLFHTTNVMGDGVEGFRADLQDAILAAEPIIEPSETIQERPADLGAEVLDACPILRDFVEMTLPKVEADVNMIVADFLAAVGAVIGLNAYGVVQTDYHYPATYHLVVADSGAAKGVVYGNVNRLMELAVPDLWRKVGRFSARSGQALKRIVKEASDPTITVKNDDDEPEEKPNPDYTGGRIFLRLSEVSGVFKSMHNDKWSTMGSDLLELFDGKRFSNELAKREDSTRGDHPYSAAILGDIPPFILGQVLPDADFASGCANRFVWCASYQTKVIPRPGHSPDYRALAARLRRVIPQEAIGEVDYSAAGGEVWDAWVLTLPQREDSKLSLACQRMRANALRLAVLFAVLDERRLDESGLEARRVMIEPEHVRAAAAIMNRHRATVSWWLNRPVKLPTSVPEAQQGTLWKNIQKLRDYIAKTGTGSITGTELYNLFSNVKVDERRKIAEAAGLHESDRVDAKGNTVKVWS